MTNAWQRWLRSPSGGRAVQRLVAALESDLESELPAAGPVIVDSRAGHHGWYAKNKHPDDQAAEIEEAWRFT